MYPQKPGNLGTWRRAGPSLVEKCSWEEMVARTAQVLGVTCVPKEGGMMVTATQPWQQAPCWRCGNCTCKISCPRGVWFRTCSLGGSCCDIWGFRWRGRCWFVGGWFDTDAFSDVWDVQDAGSHCTVGGWASPALSPCPCNYSDYPVLHPYNIPLAAGCWDGSCRVAGHDLGWALVASRGLPALPCTCPRTTTFLLLPNLIFQGSSNAVSLVCLRGARAAFTSCFIWHRAVRLPGFQPWEMLNPPLRKCSRWWQWAGQPLPSWTCSGRCEGPVRGPSFGLLQGKQPIPLGAAIPFHLGLARDGCPWDGNWWKPYWAGSSRVGACLLSSLLAPTAPFFALPEVQRVFCFLGLFFLPLARQTDV